MFRVLRDSSIARGTVRGAVEFVIIVAGVLVALMAEEWRQSRANETLETEYLERLAIDLREDLVFWGFANERLELKTTALESLQRWLRDPDRSEEALQQLIVDLTDGTRLGRGSVAAARVTFEELVSTGRLQLLSDSSLRAALIAYHEQVETQDARVISRRTRYPARVYQIVPNESDFNPRRDLAHADLLLIADQVSDGNLSDLATAELNFGRELMQVVKELSPSTESILAAVQAQLAEHE